MGALAIIGQLAWRNLWRTPRRTLIMLAAVSIGVWAMIFMIALMRGMVDDMVRDGIRALPGHVQVHHPDFRDDPSVANLVTVPDSELARRFGAAGFKAWASRLRVPAVISSERESRGVVLVGIDPAAEGTLSFLADAEIDGRALQGVDDTGLLIGRKLADTLDTRLGKRVVVMSQDPDNDIADRGFRVTGLFHTKLQTHEETFVFAGKATLQKMLRVGDRVTEVAILGEDYRDVEAVRERAAALAGDQLEVRPWHEIDTYLGAMLGVMDGFVLVWIVVIFLALSFGLVNTLVMAVFERVREIGLMLALGMKPRSILGQIVLESLLLLLLGLAIGNLLAWTTIQPLEGGIDLSVVGEGMEMFGATSVLYPKLQTSDIVLADAVVLILGALASLLPAWRAARYQPVEAIARG